MMKNVYLRLRTQLTHRLLFLFSPLFFPQVDNFNRLLSCLDTYLRLGSIPSKPTRRFNINTKAERSRLLGSEKETPNSPQQTTDNNDF